MKKLVLIFLMMTQLGLSQVGINTTTPQAQLDIKSSNQVTPSNTDGILIPKIDAFPLTTPTALQQGMLVYLTTLSAGKPPGFYYWDNVTINWIGLGGSSASSGWSLTGDAGTNSATNFIGTTDDNDLVFRRNNIISGKIATYSTSFGNEALFSNTTGDYNTAIGSQTLYNNTDGHHNMAFGNSALSSNTSGAHNVAFGFSALSQNNNGLYNVAMGSIALSKNVAGISNTAIGAEALREVTGSNNTALGFDAGVNTTTGNNNIAIGANTNVPNIAGNNQMSIANVIYGANMSTTALGKIGIGVPVPTEKLEVAGKTKTTDLQVTTGAGVGKVLTSDAVGNATWQNAAGGSGWLTTGNAGTNPATNFIGTTDDVDLVFKRFNIESGKITSSSVFLGMYAGSLTTSAIGGSVGIGYNALKSGTGPGLGNSYGNFNVAIGYDAIGNNVDGGGNVAVGGSALSANSRGSENTALGNRAGDLITTGSNNISIGANTDVINPAGNDQMSIGNVIYGANMSTTALGKIGIGVVPTEKLEVAGKTKTTTFQMTTGAAANTLLVSDALGNGTWQNPNTALNSFAWKTTGNSGTSAATNFIGTTDDVDLVFKRNNIRAGYINSSDNNTSFGLNALNPLSTGAYNTAIGGGSLFSNTSGFKNISFGYQTLYKNTDGLLNLAIGNQALYNNITGSFNIANGDSALYKNTTGIMNIATGASALYGNTTGGYNTAIGHNAIGSNTSGTDNTVVGHDALFYNTIGNDNVAIGNLAMRYNNTGSGAIAIGKSAMEYAYPTTITNMNVAIGYESLKGSFIAANNTGNSNTAVGYQTMIVNSTGSYNTASGGNALRGNTTGESNTANGYAALNVNSTGNYNTANGHFALSSNTTGTNNTANGNGALYFNTTGNQNTAYGAGALSQNDIGNYNTALGYSALTNNVTGSRNVAIGYTAGQNEAGSNKLYIENSGSSTPLIYGEFDNDLARINGNFRVKSTTVASAEMQVKNSNLYNHPGDNNLNFGTGGGYFMMSTQDASPSTETGGIRGDGDNVSIWSPGDGGRQLRILDEDNWTDNNGNPYDNGAEVAYIASNGQYFQVSDKNKKENIVKIEKASDKISQISGYTYQYKLNKQEIEKGQKPVSASGVLAQEIEQVLPEAIQKNETGEYFVDYAAITPLLIEALKDQNVKIKSLEAINAEILKRLEKLENK